MKDLKAQLIRLGSKRPELRHHLRPILAKLDASKKAHKSRDDDPAAFDRAVQGFLRSAQRIVDKAYKDSHKGIPQLKLAGGRRYLRIAKVDHTGSRSAYGFIDTKNGNVLKAAGWKRPAKGVRSNIFDADFGVSVAGPYGIASLR